MLVQYVKKKRRSRKRGIMIPTRVGVMIAMPVDDNHVHVCWSKCNINIDEFTDLGLNMAIDRARKNRVHPIALSMRKPMKKFMERVESYYKDKAIVPVFSENYAPDEKGKILGSRKTQTIHV